MLKRLSTGNLFKPGSAFARRFSPQCRFIVQQQHKNIAYENLDNAYEPRHIGPQPSEQQEMLRVCGVETIEELMDQTIPHDLRRGRELELPAAVGEQQALADFQQMMSKNKVFRTHIGQGYHNCVTPSVLLRCFFENPSWYTPYTPYQAEIAQGRLEMLLNFQTMVADLTGMEISNASLLDEALSAAEAAVMTVDVRKKKTVFHISSACHPQTIDVCQTRLTPLGITVKVMDDVTQGLNKNVAGVLVQNPGTNGEIDDITNLCKTVHDAGALVVCATDLLACTMFKSPGEMGADMCVGTNQRFGVPMGFGGPHAGFLATKDQYKRKMPGRLIGVSLDARSKKAYRLSLQTREQHIRRDKATSNICTAQALLANLSAAYAIFHGPKGLKKIATRVHNHALRLAKGLRTMGFEIASEKFFDTVAVSCDADAVMKAAESRMINFRKISDSSVGITLDETTSDAHIDELFEIFAEASGKSVPSVSTPESPLNFMSRTSPYLTHPVFNSHHSETAMMRYLYKLEKRDLGLNTGAMPLGSCTMKLNAATCMLPVTWPTVNQIHPFAPASQREGYDELIKEMEILLAEITGFHSISLQPNSGSQGEYAGVMAIREYHITRGEPERKVCLIPANAHGTNPASATFAGMKVVPVKCDAEGHIDFADLTAKADKHASELSCIMITYPSTHGVFEEEVKEVCELIHARGGQVYMDGANLQAQVGYCTPDNLGADVCHLNLHKTFCIPHGGGGPGLGPIGVREHLAPFLPNHPLIKMGGEKSFGSVSAAPWSSASILPIPYLYIKMMGPDGLKRATETAILSANYMMTRLKNDYSVLFTGSQGRCAHEFILDIRPMKTSGVTEEDLCKRMMDYNLHAPTMSWPVAGTLMVEPTESEPKEELDHMVDSLLQIRKEFEDVISGKVKPEDSPLRGAPHTADVLTDAEWNKTYSRHYAAYPLPSLKENKYWPYVGRIDNVYGDKNIICSCPSVEDYE